MCDINLLQAEGVLQSTEGDLVDIIINLLSTLLVRSVLYDAFLSLMITFLLVLVYAFFNAFIHCTEFLLVSLQSIYRCLSPSTPQIVPDNPEQGVLVMFRGLLTAVAEYPWSSESDSLAIIYTRALHLLSAYAQPKYIHKIEQGRTFKFGVRGWRGGDMNTSFLFSKREELLLM